jgi:RDD family
VYGPPPDRSLTPMPASGAPPPAPHGDAAPAGRRALAWMIDFALVLAVAVALGTWTFHRIAAHTTGVTGMAGVSAWRLLTSGGDVTGTAGDVGLSLWHSAVTSVEEAFVLLVLFEVAYVFGALAWRGRTLGKALLDVQVRPCGAELPPGTRVRLGTGRAARRAMVTVVTDTALYALACCLLLGGDLILAVLCWMAAVAAFWANVLPLLGKRRRTVADRIAGTTVSRAGTYQAVVAGTVQSGRAAAQGAVRGGRAAVGGAVNLATPERVRRIQDAGRGAATQGRDALRRAGEAYRERRAARPSEPPLPLPLPYAPPPPGPPGIPPGSSPDPRYGPAPGVPGIPPGLPPHPRYGSPSGPAGIPPGSPPDPQYGPAPGAPGIPPGHPSDPRYGPPQYAPPPPPPPRPYGVPERPPPDATESQNPPEDH